MDSAVRQQGLLDAGADDFYRSAMATLRDAGVPFLVGGAFAFACYTGIERDTKDIDLFIRRSDLDAALAAFEAAGCSTEVPYPHWLAKAHCGEHFVDIIFRSGNGLNAVDDNWFAHAPSGAVCGLDAGLMPAEELLCSKAFVQERERFDGADVAHLLRSCAERLDWARLLARFGPHWRVLLAHLVLFGFIYPGERGRVPAWVMAELTARLHAEVAAPPAPAAAGRCCGTLLSREQYLVDVERLGYRDGRARPEGPLSAEEIAIWTRAIEG